MPYRYMDHLMKNHFNVLTALSILALAAVGCAPPGGSDSDVAGVRAWSDAMLAAQTAGDVDASMDLLTDDAVGMPPDGTILRDADAWRAYWENLYSGDSLEAALSDEEYQADGDWGFVSGTWTVSVAAEEAGESQRAAAYFVVVVHREDVGAWKLARVIWHPTQPATEE
jgi:ketosteroid isomerase-like protein